MEKRSPAVSGANAAGQAGGVAASSGTVPLADDEDVAAMRALAAGDDRALRGIIERWQAPLLNFFFRSLGDRSTAEELVQTTFLRLYRAAGRYRPEAKFSTYLFQIGRRLLINEYRRRSRKPLDLVDPAELTGSVSGRQPLEQRELEEVFRAALDQLPEQQKTALLWLQQQELSYDEIAAAMGVPVSSVKTWIYRARVRLKELLGDLHA